MIVTSARTVTEESAGERGSGLAGDRTRADTAIAKSGSRGNLPVDFRRAPRRRHYSLGVRRSRLSEVAGGVALVHSKGHGIELHLRDGHR